MRLRFRQQKNLVRRNIVEVHYRTNKNDTVRIAKVTSSGKASGIAAAGHSTRMRMIDDPE